MRQKTRKLKEKKLGKKLHLFPCLRFGGRDLEERT